MQHFLYHKVLVVYASTVLSMHIYWALAGHNVDERFSYVGTSVQDFCLRTSKTLYCSRVSKDTFGFESLQKCPHGCWQKASDTTVLSLRFQAFCEQHLDNILQNDILRWTYVGITQINLALTVLFEGGLWLTKAEAGLAAASGLNFLKAYGHLVDCTVRANRDRFPLLPKLHYLHHLFHTLKSDSERCDWCLNLVASTVQADEEICSDLVALLISYHVLNLSRCSFMCSCLGFRRLQLTPCAKSGSPIHRSQDFAEVPSPRCGEAGTAN